MELIKTGKLLQRELDSILFERRKYENSLYNASIYSSKERSKYNPEIRSGKIYFLDPQHCPKTINILQTTIIEKYLGFDFDFSNISSVQFAQYDLGDKFVWHQDVIYTEDLLLRSFTMSVNLTPEKNYTGGELLLYHNKNIIELNKEPGSYIIFPSFLYHQASEVFDGRRESMVVWIQSEQRELKKLRELYVKEYGKIEIPKNLNDSR